MEITYNNSKYKIQFGLGRGLTTGVALFSIISIIVFILTQFSNKEYFFQFFGFVPQYAIGGMRIWQFFTAIFVHGDFGHLLFNLVALYLFGGPVEKIFRTKEFILYFFVCGTGSYILTYILWVINLIPDAICVGASGSIYGLLFAFSVLYARHKILLFFVVPIQAKWLALIFGGIEFVLLLYNGGISHIGHLGGFLAGIGYFAYTLKYPIFRSDHHV